MSGESTSSLSDHLERSGDAEALPSASGFADGLEGFERVRVDDAPLARLSSAWDALIHSPLQDKLLILGIAIGAVVAVLLIRRAINELHWRRSILNQRGPAWKAPAPGEPAVRRKPSPSLRR
ncbi:MAG: hypothetical protein ACPGID_07675 [Rubricella sp.]